MPFVCCLTTISTLTGFSYVYVGTRVPGSARAAIHTWSWPQNEPLSVLHLRAGALASLVVRDWPIAHSSTSLAWWLLIARAFTGRIAYVAQPLPSGVS